MTKKGCILSAPLVFYNFDTQHAEFMNYIQMTTKISVNDTLAVVSRLLPPPLGICWGRTVLGTSVPGGG